MTIEKIIGKGAFGQVAKGTAAELQGRPGMTTVAIKMLKCKMRSQDFLNSLRLVWCFFYLVQHIP